uniref:Uncharacterized protein n=1 Tax=Noctiluca scintillans TaxID=2966 RepID=A0A7S1AWI7_NOCSC
MGSLRSWSGSLLTLGIFFIVKRFTVGFAFPLFASTAVASVCIWFFVLRVPELGKLLPEAQVSWVPATVRASGDGTSPDIATDSAATDDGGQVEIAEAAGGHVDAATVSGGQIDTAEASGGQVDAARASGGQVDTAKADQVHSADSDLFAQHVEPGTTEENEPLGEGAVEGATRCNQITSDFSESDDEQGVTLDESHCDLEQARVLKGQGNEFFRSGQLHDAREAYSEALHLMPSEEKTDRAVLFANRAACFQKMERWDETVADCKSAVDLDPAYTKAYCRRSVAFEALGKWHDALEDLNKAIELDASIRSREYKRQAMLDKRSKEQFEKDKDEMVGKLKDLGNMVLGKFGMSVDNFKMEQDPATGSYSVKYQN